MSQQVSNKSNVDQQLVNAVVNATTEVLSTMAFTKTQFQSVNTETTFRPSGDISAVIGLVSDKGAEGIIALSYPMSLARIIVARLLGLDPKQISDEDISDGVRELVNMISGGIKASLSQTSQCIYKLTLPAVIRGKEHEVTQSSPVGSNYLQLLFEADGETFMVQVALKE